MKMDLERIGSRQRDNSQHFAAESQALDQIAKEVSTKASHKPTLHSIYKVKVGREKRYLSFPKWRDIEKKNRNFNDNYSVAIGNTFEDCRAQFNVLKTNQCWGKERVINY